MPTVGQALATHMTFTISFYSHINPVSPYHPPLSAQPI